jgi:hypothetical protein
MCNFQNTTVTMPVALIIKYTIVGKQLLLKCSVTIMKSLLYQWGQLIFSNLYVSDF